MAKWDAVVIGAGNAGLMAALELAYKGKKVLMVEQHNLPGGCATSFVRGRFEMEASLHELCGAGNQVKPGLVYNLFQKLGVSVDFVDVPDCFRAVGHYTDGGLMDVSMPTGREAFLRKMEEYVPSSRESMEAFFSLVDALNDGMDSVSSGDIKLKKLLKETLPALRVGSYNTMEVLKALHMPQRAIDILGIYWSYLGVELEEISFIHFGGMANSYITEGAKIPKATSHAMSEALATRFLELGGELWYGVRAKEILFDKGHVCGVRTTAGDVEASHVLCNVNEDLVYGSLVPSSLVPKKTKRLSSARKNNYGGRLFTAYLCLDASPEELGIQDYALFVSGSADSKATYTSVMKGIEENEYLILLCYNILNPEASPEGTTIVSFTTFAPKEDWENLGDFAYARQKERYIEKMLSTLKKYTKIDLNRRIEEIVSASPLTFARYLGTPEGCVYGHETRGWDNVVARTLSLKKSFPIPGLWTIGANGHMGDGYISAYRSGSEVSALVLKAMEKEARK